MGRPPIRSGAASRRSWHAVALGAIVVMGLLAPTLNGIAYPVHALPSATPRLAIPLPRPGHFPTASGIRPSASSEWYTQEGATLSAVSGSYTASPATLIENLTLVNSPYSTGYELNGLSSTGDWYQVVIGDNWPGCNAGFEEVLEVWDSTGASGPVTCDSTLTLSTGDSISFQLSLPSTSNGCLTIDDLTAATSHQVCQSQPDSGATGFTLLTSAANGNGYYTGPMTETVNLTASSCPDYTHLPLLSYRYPVPFYVTGYVPWSDEFDLATGTFCYSNQGSLTTLSPGDPSAQYVDTASGTGLGPRWGAGENLSFLRPGFGFQYQTDPIPLTGATLWVGPTLLTLGQAATFYVNASGGVAPYSALLAVNGSVRQSGGSPGTFVPQGAGTYTLTGYAVDSQLDVYGPSNAVVVSVPGILAVGPVAAAPTATSADAGQSVTFSAHVTGGIAPRTYTWSGLPTNCTPVDAASLTCVPSTVGNYTVHLSVQDSNHSTVFATPLPFRVFSDPAARVSASTLVLDVRETVNFTANASGGTGLYGYSWAGLPTGCTGGNVSALSCRPAVQGSFLVTLTVTDSDAYAVAAGGGVRVVVNGPLAATLSSTHLSADVGENVSFVVHVTGGTAPFTFSFSGLPLGCFSENLSTLSCRPTASGSFLVQATAIDATGALASSGVVGENVFSALTVSVSVAPGSVALGGSVTITALASGGASTASITWTELPPGCTPVGGPTVVCTPSATGDFNATAHAADSTGTVAVGSAVVQVVAPASSALFGGGGGSLWLWVALAVGLAAIAVGVAVALRRRQRRR